MTCEKFLPMIHERLDGELGQEERGSLDAHLGVCRGCRDTFDRLRRVDSALREVVPVQPPLGSSRLLADAVWARGRSRKVRARRFHVAGPAGAVVIAAAATAGTWIELHRLFPELLDPTLERLRFLEGLGDAGSAMAEFAADLFRGLTGWLGNVAVGAGSSLTLTALMAGLLLLQIFLSRRLIAGRS